MKVEILSVGTEVLMGNVLNSNTYFLARKCSDYGYIIEHESVVGDNVERMTEAIKTALARADMLILTGGLGPTEDDMTSFITAKVLGLPMYENPEALKHIEERLKNLHRESHIASSKRVAMVPETSKLIMNPNGTAPGIIVEKDGKVVILLPGPPHEIKAIFENGMDVYLKSKSDLRSATKMVKITGVGEASVEKDLLDLIDAQKNPTIATYAKLGECHVRITAFSQTEEEAKSLVENCCNEVVSRFGDSVYTTEESVTLEEALVNKLKECHKTITVAESMTCGMLASYIGNVSGASEVFRHGYVTYSDEAKINDISVPKEIIDKYTAISPECALEMAKGALKKSGADLAISITGNAGPSASCGKAIGETYIAYATKDKIAFFPWTFKGDRESIRISATMKALDTARRALLLWKF